jgi:transmembrane sensor
MYLARIGSSRGAVVVGDSIDWVLVTRYLNHSCTNEERRAVRAWAEADPANARALDEARRVWEATGGLPPTWDIGATWQAIESRLDAGETSSGAPARMRPIRHRPAVAWWSRSPVRVIAAAIVVALGVGVALRTVGRGLPLAVAGREYVTVPGQRETVTLADGTEMTLAPGSRLRLAADYGASRRDVVLEGQAYFAVVHDAARPFVVHTANTVTKDIGTRFVVRAYPEDRATRVVVAEGAVSVADSVLERGMLARVAGDSAITVQRGVDLDAYMGWTRGELVFQATPVTDAIHDLARWYGLDMRLADPTLAHGAITASFQDEALDDVLHSVAIAIGATVERDGHRVVFARAARGKTP